MYKHNDLLGKRFGRLIVVGVSGRTKDRHILWRCLCDCGNETSVCSKDLTSGHTVSCGCYCKERTSEARRKHGGVGDRSHVERLYKVWVAMRKRCNTPTDKSYKYYGAKGVTVCKEWDDYATFKEWAYKNGYDESAERGACTIDRINPFGNYEPSNCRWITMEEQRQNTRKKHKDGDGE